ncbi:MAG TPA: hypothetical protein DCL35_00275 [Candidatus Omnitrophica bacterium]|nr:hypothetical protein [Candidatus Omnitrophota bacterium]
MQKNIVITVLSGLFLTGCATSIERIDGLEARLDTLEKKSAVAVEKKGPKASEEIIGTETLAVPSEKIAIPESPTKKDYQAALKNAGFYQGEVDGKFGPRSKKAVEDFQVAHDLKVDGKVGPNTWDKLKEYYVPTETQTKQ